MKGNFENKLSDEGITLPDAPAPAANYVPYVQVENVLLCFWTNLTKRERPYLR